MSRDHRGVVSVRESWGRLHRGSDICLGPGRVNRKELGWGEVPILQGKHNSGVLFPMMDGHVSSWPLPSLLSLRRIHTPSAQHLVALPPCSQGDG